MRLMLTEDQEQFKAEVEAFLDREWRPDPAAGGFDQPREMWERNQQFRRKLADRRWLTLAWPTEWGGGGASPLKQAIYNEVMSYRGAPSIDMGADRVGPAIMMFGTDEQKHEFLPPITSATVNWCQGFSEPGAGSDLAGLQTRAIAEGDSFIVNGQKIWTSNAHHAEWMMLLVRTDVEAPKHRGISVLLLDMKTPGIEVVPLINMAGGHGFNEVFFNDVRVPRNRLLGELNRGWYVTATTLDFERSGIARIAPAKRYLDQIRTLLAEDPSLLTPRRRLEFADLHIEYEVGRLLAYRVAWMQENGLVPNHEASMSKAYGSEVQQRVARFAVNLVGLGGQLRPGSPHASIDGLPATSYMGTTALSIAGGTSEVQRNIIATRGLNMPRG
ncbi:MAG TPA: acyl-CoA dehydrogenase family protein [Dehalococcoidia bacterium]|nr:acyl-CoA dehydrogenase family protein [Dehalococcoidia bacterium]